jgi:hypothetical protein
MGQVWLHLVGPATPTGPAVLDGADVPSSCGTLVPFPPKCVPVHKIATQLVELY